MEAVWIAKTESWDGSMILGVYSTESLAQAAVEKHMAKCDSPQKSIDKSWNTVIKFEIDQDAKSHGYLLDTTGDKSVVTQYPMGEASSQDIGEFKL